MPSERIEVIVDGRATAFGAGEPVVSGADAPWSGFLLERVGGVALPEGCSLGHPHTLLVQVLEGEASIAYRVGTERHRFRAGPDSLCLWPAGAREDAFCWSGRCELVAVRVSEGEVGLAGWSEDGVPPRPLAAHRIGVLDPPLARLVESMEAEVRTGCPNGPLYAEALSTALAAYLSTRYGQPADAGIPADDGEVARIAPLLAHVRNNLAGDLSVPALAALAGLSEPRLCRLFRQALGMTPHRYVLRERIRRACKLLREGRRSLAQIADSLGFATQSHFTEAFRRATGTTPGRYRQDA